jgi:hypothetical protein
MTVKVDLLDAMRHERAALLTTLSAANSALLTQPALVGGWSVAQLLAHLTVADWRLIQAISVLRCTGSLTSWETLSDAQVEEANRQIAARTAAQPFAPIWTRFTEARELLMQAIAGLTEEELLMPVGPQSYSFEQLIAGDTWMHEQEHRPDIARAIFMALHAAPGAAPAP